MDWNVIPPAEWLETEDEVIRAAEYLYNACQHVGIAFDTETTGLDITKDKPLLFSASDGRRRFAARANWMHHPWVKNGLLENTAIFKTGSNLKFDMHMSENYGIKILGQKRDSIVMSWLQNENRFGHGLKDLAKEHLGIQMLSFKEVFPMRHATKNRPAETSGEAIERVMADPEGRKKAIEYSGLDAFASHRLHDYLAPELHRQEMYPGYTLLNHFLDVETEFTDVLYRMERRGFTIDAGHLLSQKGPMLKAMEELEAEFARMAGWVVNMNSPKQLQRLFFEQLQRTPIKFTETKQPSTDEEVLNIWAGDGDPWAQLLLKHRKISKIHGTYVEGLLSTLDPEVRIHTTLNQAGTVTGRLSSREPNLQNIPRPKTDKFKIRNAFVADLGKRLIDLDYDQLEMKIMAHYSQDQKMINAIKEGLDLHCFTVSLMFNESYDEVIEAKKNEKSGNLTDRQESLLLMRQAAKNVGFGLIYGIGPGKLSMDLTEETGKPVSKEDAQNLIRQYFSVYPGVDQFIKQTHQYCRRTEYVQTLVGRFRRLPQINAKGGDNEDFNAKGVAGEAKRQAVNTIIQGTAADIAKRAMMRIDQDPVLAQLGLELKLQIHDELISEIDDVPDRVNAAIERKKGIMEKPWEEYDLSVPLTVGGGSGYTWASSK